MKFFAILSFLLATTQLWAGWSVSTYNIRNFDQDPGGATDHAELARIIQTVKSDVMAFEEVVNVPAFEELVGKALPGYKIRVSSCGGFGKQSLAIAYNPKVFTFKSEIEDMSFSGSMNNSCGSLRPAFFVTLAMKGTKEEFVFGVLHLKAGGTADAMNQRWLQYKKLVGVAIKYQNQNLVLLGDLNTTGYNIQNDDYSKFEDFMSRSAMRTMSEEIGCTNYWGNPAQLKPSILDHIVLQERNVVSVQEIELGAHCAEHDCRPATAGDLGPTFESVSDHCPVKVTFK